MTDQEINVAIAESCGWESVCQCHRFDGGSIWVGLIPGIAQDIQKEIPDFCNDLNAMHEAEKSLMLGKAVRYRLNLQSLSDGANAKFASAEAALCHATARQRAEAYLRTIGRWKD